MEHCQLRQYLIIYDLVLEDLLQIFDFLLMNNFNDIGDAGRLYWDLCDQG